MIIIAITVIGTTATTEVISLVIRAAGVMVDQADLLVIRVMEAQVITVIETTAEAVLLVGIQKVLFFVMAIPLFVIQAVLLVLEAQSPLLLLTQVEVWLALKVLLAQAVQVTRVVVGFLGVLLVSQVFNNGYTDRQLVKH